jgi:hypothetical protein
METLAPRRIRTKHSAVIVLCLSFCLSSCGGGSANNAPTLSSITLTPSTVTLTAGQTQQLTATTHYSDGSTKDVTSTATWVSSDTTIATVSGAGLVTSLVAGQVTITASVSGVSKSVAITVSAAVANLSPSLSSVSPETTAAGSYLGLNVTGSGFVATSVMRWNGIDQVTGYISQAQLTANVPATYLANTGQAEVTVLNPGGGTSNSLSLTGSRTLSLTGSLQTPRVRHTSTLLENGKVLIAGGFNQVVTSLSAGPLIVLGSTEIFDPALNSFTSGPNLVTPRYRHSATLLFDGRVLISGGSDANGTAVASTELYDPGTQTISGAASAPVAGGSFAFRLSDGRVLMFGGQQQTSSDPLIAQIYDPVSNSFSIAGQSGIFDVQSATLLPSDKVLLIGNSGACDPRNICPKSYTYASIYDSATGTFSDAGYMSQSRESENAVLVSADGAPKVLIIGGGWDLVPLNSSELFDIATGTFNSGPAMFSWRIGSSATLLPDGSALVIGGAFSPASCGSAPAEVWTPTTNDFSIAAPVSYPGCNPQLTLLPDGSVLISGGNGDMGMVATAWIFR